MKTIIVMLFFTIQHQIKGINKLKILKGIVYKHISVGACLCNPKPDRLTNCYCQILSKCVHKQYAKYSWYISQLLKHIVDMIIDEKF
jgi:hypothetical protein